MPNDYFYVSSLSFHQENDASRALVMAWRRRQSRAAAAVVNRYQTSAGVAIGRQWAAITPPSRRRQPVVEPIQLIGRSEGRIRSAN